MKRTDSVDALLASVAARTPAPGGGASAGLACALGAALTAMGARFAERDADAQRADALRERALALAEADADAFAPVLVALRLPREDPDRPERLRTAQAAAADVPLAIAEAAADVAELARRVARDGKPWLTGDSLTGAELAAAAARAAARLAQIDLAGEPGDPRRGRARAAAERAGG